MEWNWVSLESEIVFCRYIWLHPFSLYPQNWLRRLKYFGNHVVESRVIVFQIGNEDRALYLETTDEFQGSSPVTKYRLSAADNRYLNGACCWIDDRAKSRFIVCCHICFSLCCIGWNCFSIFVVQLRYKSGGLSIITSCLLSWPTHPTASYFLCDTGIEILLKGFLEPGLFMGVLIWIGL